MSEPFPKPVPFSALGKPQFDTPVAALAEAQALADVQKAEAEPVQD